jgi:hypothetical protein
MPADHKVSVAWQIVFTFIPIVNLWAFYRIRKLRKYLLYVVVPAIVLSVLFTEAFFGDLYYNFSTGRQTAWGDEAFGQSESNYTEHQPLIVERIGPGDPWSPLGVFMRIFASYGGFASVIRIAFQGLAIYLVIKWSIEHNRTYDTRKPETG